MEADAIKKGITSMKISSIGTRKDLSMIKRTKEDGVEQKVEDIKIKMKTQFQELLTEASR